MKATSVANIVLAGLIGVLLGVLAHDLFWASSAQTASKAFFDQETARQEEYAARAFATLDPAGGIFAQNWVMDYAENRKRVGYLDEQTYNRIVGMARARIGVIYLSTNRAEEAAGYINDALVALKKGGVVIDRQELVRSLEKFKTTSVP